MLPARGPARSWSLAALWLAVIVGLYLFFVHASPGRRLDERVFNAVPRHHTIWFRLSGMLLGSEIVWAVAGLAVAVAIGLRSHRHRQLAVGLGVALISAVLGELLKHVLLSRPSADAAAAVSNSFPSGHTVLATAMVVAMCFVVSDRRRPPVVTVGSLLAVLVGIVTIVQQWHRLSDVLSAYALVAACAYAGRAILQSGPRRGSSPREQQ